MAEEKKKPKKSQPSISKLPKPKSLRELNVTLGWRSIPIGDNVLRILGEELVKWVRDHDDALKIESFLIWQGISWQAWDNYLKRSEFLRDAQAYAQMVIGERRELGGLRKIYDTSMIMRSMPMYDQKWKDLNEWYAKLKEGQDAQGATIHVHMDKIPSPDEKRLKEEKKEGSK